MGEVLEWFQCSACGRRYRWNADIAGTYIRCQCGKSVLCPELDVFSPSQDMDNTILETVDSPTARSPSESMIGFDPIAAADETVGGETVRIRHKGTGIFGLTTQGQLGLWFCLSLVALAAVIHAVITMWTAYIVVSVLLSPIAFINLWRVQRRWRRGRKLTTALRQLVEEWGD